MSYLLVDSLRRLCEAQGGTKALAKVLQVHDQSLYQIISGIKLPSGKPRGIGRNLREKLDKHFPGWDMVLASKPRGLPATTIQAPPASGSALLTAQQERDAVARLGELLAAVPVGPRRSALAALLSAYAQDGGAPQYVEAVMALLHPGPAQETGPNRAHG